MISIIPAPETFTIFKPAAGWTAELLTTAEDLEYMAGAYEEQRGMRPGVAMCPTTWVSVGDLFSRVPQGLRRDTPLRVVLSAQHDPGTITFFDDDIDAAGLLGNSSPGVPGQKDT